MPLWLWIILVAIALSIGAYRKFNENSAIKQRGREIDAERAERRNLDGGR
jgi:hypothetical protein